MESIRLVLVDDHQIMREGLRLVLAREPGFEVIGEAADGESGLQLVVELRPDVAVVDIEMPRLNGIELAARLRVECPDTKVLILSGAAEFPSVREALRAGVSGFLIKTGAADELTRAIRAASAGEVYFCSQVSTVLAQVYRRGESADGTPAPNLSQREIDILRRIADGQSTKEIAFALELSTKTVETHRANLMSKLGIHSVAGLTKYAVRERYSSL
jgi:DNA-binding NarL/FixJ family response regulator